MSKTNNRDRFNSMLLSDDIETKRAGIVGLMRENIAEHERALSMWTGVIAAQNHYMLHTTTGAAWTHVEGSTWKTVRLAPHGCGVTMVSPRDAKILADANDDMRAVFAPDWHREQIAAAESSIAYLLANAPAS